MLDFVRRMTARPSMAQVQMAKVQPAACNQQWDAEPRRHVPMQTRADILQIVRPNGVGVELGVSRGFFSALLLEAPVLGYLYGVDSYGDATHGVDKYADAVARLAPYRNRNAILRMRFDEAAQMFPDGYFDFVYIDGCASNGQEGGRTLRDWWPKVRPGGVFSGHDYAAQWPRVVRAVDSFAAGVGQLIGVVGGEPNEADPQNRYASWIMVRPARHF